MIENFLFKKKNISLYMIFSKYEKKSILKPGLNKDCQMVLGSITRGASDHNAKVIKSQANTNIKLHTVSRKYWIVSY